MFARKALQTIKKPQCRTFVSKTTARLAGPEKQLPGQPQNAMKTHQNMNEPTTMNIIEFQTTQLVEMNFN